MSDGLKAQHRAAIIAALAANDRVERAVLFGSRAMGTNTITSDVDIALFGDRLTLTDQAHLAATCDDLPMAQSVDLVLHNTIDNPALVDHIRTHGVEWYRRGGASEVSRAGLGDDVLEGQGWNMGSEWKRLPLCKVTENLDFKRVPVKESDRKPGIYPYYGASGIIDHINSFIFDGEYVLVAEDGENLRSRKSPIAFFARGKFWVNNHAHILSGNRHSDTQFLSYMIESCDVSGYLTGSTIPKLTQGNLDKIEFLFPPLEEQKAIAHVLGTLDDKIALNRRMNETLEAMARALFKDWFVDFGPVRAKVEGQEAYLPEEIWGLFPDSFQESELGEIPRGWGVKPLSEIATFLNGLALQKHPATSPEDSLPVIKIAELRNGVSAKTDKASRNIPKKYIVTDGDFLFAWSGSLMAQFWTEGEGALNQHLFKVTSDQYPPWFFAGWVRFHMGEFQRIAASKATTMGHIQRSHLQAATVSCPPDAAVAGLDAVIKPLVRRGVSARVESRSLAKVRDLLLPKLMSGEIRVREGEKVMEVAA